MDLFAGLKRGFASVTQSNPENRKIEFDRSHDANIFTVTEWTFHVFLSITPMQNLSLVKNGNATST